MSAFPRIPETFIITECFLRLVNSWWYTLVQHRRYSCIFGVVLSRWEQFSHLLIIDSCIAIERWESQTKGSLPSPSRQQSDILTTDAYIHGTISTCYKCLFSKGRKMCGLEARNPISLRCGVKVTTVMSSPPLAFFNFKSFRDSRWIESWVW